MKEEIEDEYFKSIIGKCFKYKFHTRIPHAEYLKVDTYVSRNKFVPMKKYILNGTGSYPIISRSDVAIGRSRILEFEEISEEEYNSVVNLYKETYEKVLKLLNK